MRNQFPGEGIVFIVQRQGVPALRFAFDMLQHNELRQRQQGNGGKHRNTDALHAHFPPALQRIAQKKHVREVARNNEKDLHPEGVDKIVKQRQPPRRLRTIDVPDVARINQGNMKRDPQQHEPCPDGIKEIFALCGYGTHMTLRILRLFVLSLRPIVFTFGANPTRSLTHCLQDKHAK